MYVAMEQAPVLGAMFARPSMQKMRYRPAGGPQFLFAGLGLVNQANLSINAGGLTAAQAKACTAAQAWLAQHPQATSVLTSAACGVCPPPVTPESQGYIQPADCPVADGTSCADQGFIDPATCPTCGEEKSGAPAGMLPWWWILVSSAGGIALGVVAGHYLLKKKLGV